MSKTQTKKVTAKLAAFLFVLYSLKRQPVKPMANYDASVILVMYWLKR